MYLLFLRTVFSDLVGGSVAADVGIDPVHYMFFCPSE